MSSSPYSGALLKQSAIHFLTGKAASALLTFTILLWLVRLFSTQDYATYVTLVAAYELLFAISSLGLPWMAARYLPEYRLHASGFHLKAHLSWLLTIFSAALVGTALLILIPLNVLLEAADMAAAKTAAQAYLLLFLVEGLGRQVRESLLGSLLEQGSARISLVVRNAAFLAFLFVPVVRAQVTLLNVVLAELAGSALGTWLALVFLNRYKRDHALLSGEPDWQEPERSAMWGTARDMYLSHLVTLTYGPQVFLIIIKQALGVEATAVFGFLRNLYQQLQRYLPATLLFSLIRPKLVASYVGGGGIDQLSRNANLAGKLSLFALMPILVFSWLADGQLMDALSGGKFPDTGYYFAALLLALMPLSQSQILQTVAVVTGHSHLCTKAAAIGIFMLPLMYVLLQLGLGLWAPIIALVLANVLFNVVILSGIVQQTAYRVDSRGFYKLSTAALLSYFALSLTPIAGTGWLVLLALSIVSLFAFLALSYWLKPFTVDERNLINRLLPRRIFVW